MMKQQIPWDQINVLLIVIAQAQELVQIITGVNFLHLHLMIQIHKVLQVLKAQAIHRPLFLYSSFLYFLEWFA